MTPPTGLAARTNRAGNARYLGGALSMNDFAEQLNTQNEMLDGLKNTMVQTMSELRELMDNAPHEVLSEMARRMRDQLQQGGMLEIEDRLMQLLERKDTLLKGVFGENVWDEIRKEMDKQERIEARENQIQNGWQDLEEQRQQRAIDQDNYNRTYSNNDLDRMEWRGDMNEVWNIGGNNVSRADAFNGGKKARDAWDKSPEARAMSPEERARIDAQWSNYLQAIKNNDPAKAKAAYDALPPFARAQIDTNNVKQVGVAVSASVQDDARRAIDTQTSVAVGSAVFANAPRNVCGSNDLSMGSACDNVIVASHRPTVAFNQFANPQMEVEPRATLSNGTSNMSQVVETPKAKAAALEQF
jgi:hypothetical protein